MAVQIDKNIALQIVKSRFNSSKKVSSLDFERFATYYKLFRSRQTKKNYAGLADLFVPEPYRIVRRKTAKLSLAIQRIEATPEGPGDIESAKVGSHLLNFLRRKLHWHVFERTAIQESRITGLAWLKATWNVSKEDKGRPYKGFDVSFETADSVLIDPDSDLLDVFEGNNRWLIHHYESHLSSLKGNPNYDKGAISELERMGNAHMEQSSLAQSRLYSQNTDKLLDKQTRKLKIVEYWGKFEENNEEDDFIIVVANDTVLLRAEVNPYKDILDYPIPFTPIVANLVGKELYPIGDIEPAESLFNELNDTRNQRMDTVTMNIDPAKVVIKGAQIKRQDLIARRGWVIESAIPNGITFLRPDMQGVRAAIDEETAIRGDIQQVTGTLDFAQGGDSVQGGVNVDTATGASFAKGESDVVTLDELDLLKICFGMFYRIILAYAQNFLDKKFTIRVVEKGTESFHDVTKSAIQGNLDIDIHVKTLQDKTTEQNMRLALFNQAKTVPGAKLGKFFTDVLEAFNDNINIQEYYEEPQPTEERPKISIALRGEINPLMAADLGVRAGADPKTADPVLIPEYRKLMKSIMETGELPDDVEDTKADLEVAEKGLDVARTLAGGLKPERELSET